MKKIKEYVLLAVICFSLLIAYIPISRAEKNLLGNANFENQLTFWTVSSGTGSYRIDSVHHSGAFSVKGVETEPYGLGRLYQNVSQLLAAGDQCKISGWVKTENVTGNVVIGLDYVSSNGYSPNDGFITEIGHVSGTTDWTYYESSVFTVPPMPTDVVGLHFLFDFNMGSGTAWWDDVSLTLVSKATTSPNYIQFSACPDGSDWLTIENHQLSLRHRNFNPIGTYLNCGGLTDYCGFITIDGVPHTIQYVNSSYLIDNQPSIRVSFESLNQFSTLVGRGTVSWDGNHTILINDDSVSGGGLYSILLYSQNTSTAPAVPTTNDGWPMFGHDITGARYSRSAASRTNHLLWSTPLSGAVRSAVTVWGNKAYTATFDGYVYALNASTGAQVWRFTAASKVWSTPTIFNGVVYVGCVDQCTMYALNALTGAQIWAAPVGESMWSSVAVVNNIVYFGSNDNNVYALNARTGEKLWTYTTGGDIRDSPAVVNGVVYIGSQDGYFYALDATTGNKIWSSYTGDNDTYTNSSPAVVNDTVYVGSCDYNMYAFQATDGRLKWKYTTGAKVSSSPAVYNGVVYVGGEDDNLYAIDASTGRKLWNETLNGPVYSSPAVADGLVFVGSYYPGNTMYAFDAQNGTPIWSYLTNNGVFSPPVVAGGAIFVGSYDSNVYAFGSSFTPSDVIIDIPEALGNPSTIPETNETNMTILKTEWQPPAQNGVVATVVTTGAVSLAAIGVAAATSASTSTTGGIISKIIDKFREFLPKTVKSWIEGFVASKHKLQVDEKKGSPFIPTKSEIVVYIAAVIILTISFAYVEANSLNQFLLILPTFFATSIIVALVKTYILTVVARTRGVWTEYKIWYIGVVMYLVSSLAFRFPFSSPTRSVHHSRNHTKRLEVTLSCTGIIITLGFAGLFFVLLKSGFALIGGTGLAMCLIAAFFEMFPLEPMGGKTIFKYNKALWAGFFLMTLGIYAAWLLKIF
jgi:outer membrane protein assembly factor BamB